MGRFLDLGRAAGSGLSTALGHWIQAVSLALDAGAAVPDYGIAKAGPTPISIGINDTMDLALTGSIRGIDYVPVSGSWVLTPGKTYKLRASGYFDNFSDAATGYIKLAWVDDNNTPLTSGAIDSPTAFFYPVTATAANCSAGGLDFISVVPSSDAALRIVKLRATGASGTADVVSGSWTVIVEEIPG
jgi:hypothetical protein